MRPGCKAFGQKAVADLTIAIGLINTHNRLALGFRPSPSELRGHGRASCVRGLRRAGWRLDLKVWANIGRLWNRRNR